MDRGRVRGVCLLVCAIRTSLKTRFLYLISPSVETWKRRKGRKREAKLERHKERSVLAGLCNCADLIGGERKTMSLSQDWEIGKEGGRKKEGR